MSPPRSDGLHSTICRSTVSLGHIGERVNGTRGNYSIAKIVRIKIDGGEVPTDFWSIRVRHRRWVRRVSVDGVNRLSSDKQSNRPRFDRLTLGRKEMELSTCSFNAAANCEEELHLIRLCCSLHTRVRECCLSLCAPVASVCATVAVSWKEGSSGSVSFTVGFRSANIICREGDEANIYI